LGGKFFLGAILKGEKVFGVDILFTHPIAIMVAIICPYFTKLLLG